ncbi:MAG: hypothetical protein LUD41_08190 [Phascolarctobacterium sp.]|nr:hypothetical protein [Phascolarctobacterium sp.]
MRTADKEKKTAETEEMKRMFTEAMQADSNDIDNILRDEAPDRYRTAMLNVHTLKDMGKSPDEICASFMKIMGGKSPLKK